VEQCLQTGKLYRREEIEIVTAEQMPRRLGATIAPIDLSSDRGPRGALCLLTDITEVTQLREQVALKKNLESLGEMSAGLAHEFKNAIATLHGYVQLLQSLELDEEARGTASSLLNEVRNLSDMVTSFLNFARPQPLQVDEVNLNELVTDCANELAPIFKQAEVELRLNGTADARDSQQGSPILDSPAAGSAKVFAGSGHILPVSETTASAPAELAPLIIRGDERMLRQALLNLIRNAAEAIRESQTDRRVEVSSSTERDSAGKAWALVEIKDTGEGIPIADLQRIFIPFFTTKATGHGVGLALAHRVITQHGGTLTAANGKGGGAVFSLRLPA
jgi:signal transduction histidine kinase